MAVRLGINGYGRIGRACLRASLEHPEVEVVAINSTRDPKLLAHMLKYDSVYGIFNADVKAREKTLWVGDREVKILAERDPAKLKWEEADVDIVIESTGVFRSGKEARVHLQGAKKVIITAPGKGMDATFVMGVNEKDYDAGNHHVVSNASCTTNCLAPAVKVLHEKFQIKRGLMTTIHAYTNDQQILDLPHSDLRRARAAGLSIIPTSTGAARALGLVMPELQGKLDGYALRVPTPTVSVVDLVVELGAGTTVEEVNEAFREAEKGNLQGILAVSDEPLVSVDYVKNPYSCIIDSLSTMVMEENMVKIVAWYDNEWAYCNRVLDLALYIARTGYAA